MSVSFSPLLPVDDVPEGQEQTDAVSLLEDISHLQPDEQECVNSKALAMLDAKSTDFMASLPSFMQCSTDLCASWKKGQYYVELRIAYQTRQIHSLLVSEIGDSLTSALEAKDGLLAPIVKLSADKVRHILGRLNTHMSAKFDQLVSEVPAFVAPVVRAQKNEWMAQEGAQHAIAFLSSGQWDVEPLLSWSDLPAQDALRAQKAWEQLQEVSGTQFAAVVRQIHLDLEAMWSEQVAGLPSFLQKSVTEDAKQAFFKTSYPDVLAQHAAVPSDTSRGDCSPSTNTATAEKKGSVKKAKACSSRDDVAVSGHAEVNVSTTPLDEKSSIVGALDVTPKRRRRNSTTEAPVLRTVQSIHSEGVGSSGTAVQRVRGFVLQTSSTEKGALNIILADQTGLIQGLAPSLKAKEISELIAALEVQSGDSDEAPLLEFQGIKIRSLNDSVCPLSSLSFPTPCTVSAVSDSEKARFKICDLSGLNSNVYVSQFTALTGVAAPFVVNLRGVVHSVVSTGNASKGGEPIMCFKIQDSEGHLMRIVAHGQNAEHPGLRARNEVFIFFVKALPPRNSSSSSSSSSSTTVWLYDDGYVHILQENVALKSVLSEIDIA